jgi:uncharacterized protein (DUF58 family)
MSDGRLRERGQALWQWLTLDRRIQLVQPWVLLLGPVVLVCAFVAPYRWLFFVAYSYILLTLGAYLWVREVGPRVRLQRRLRSEWGQVGDALEEQWELFNDARLPLLWLEIEDASTLTGYSGRRVAAASSGEHQSWLTSAVCARRGVYTIGPLTTRLGDPLGLFCYQRRESDIRQIVIYPPLVRLPPLQIPQGQRGGLARADLLQQHVTPSVGGLREYVRGDMPSRIHWPTVAKTQRLMVKEFDQERAGALWIALDLDARAYTAGDMPIARAAAEPQERHEQSSAVAATVTTSTPDSPLELAIALVGSLAAQALAEGRAVGLLADDGRQRLITPGHGPRQLWHILGELVDAQATGQLALGDLLRAGHIARAAELSGAALVVVTPSLDGGWLPALAGWQRGRPGGALALLVAAQAAAARPIAAQLAALGVAAHTFEVGVALPLLNPPKPRVSLRVSPLGKLVRT